jgi:hypothetical protein
MNQTPNLSTLISELVTGVITGVSTARRFHFRALLVVAITVAVGAFTMGLALRDYIPGKSATAVQGAPLTPEPARNQQYKPPPSKRSDAEEVRKLIRPNPM